MDYLLLSWQVITLAVRESSGSGGGTEGAPMVLNSPVVSASVGNLTLSNLTEPVLIQLGIRNQTVRTRRTVLLTAHESGEAVSLRGHSHSHSK